MRADQRSPGAGISSYQPPEEILSDNGSQYVTWRGKSAFAHELDKRGIKHVISAPQHPQSTPSAAIINARSTNTRRSMNAQSPSFGMPPAIGSELSTNPGPLRRPTPSTRSVPGSGSIDPKIRG